MASLAELRAAAGTSKRLPTRTYELCLAQDLVAEVQQLNEERIGLIVELGGNVDDSDEATETPKGRPKRIADPRRTRVAKIDARLKVLAEEMREHSGTLVLTAINSGEWRRWLEDNPPRETGRDEQGRPILNAVDDRIAYGYCDAQALADDLHRYVTSWNDESVSDEDWEYLAGNAAPGDIKELVTLVVGMHEGVGARAPKSLSTSSSTTGTDETS